MTPRLRAALLLVLDAVADGHVTAAEALEVLETLLPRDVVLEVAEDVVEAVRKALRKRTPEELRADAARKAAKGKDERAAELLAKAAEREGE